MAPLALLAALCVVYVTHFLAIDGLRIFAVTVAIVWVEVVKRLVDGFPWRLAIRLK